METNIGKSPKANHTILETFCGSDGEKKSGKSRNLNGKKKKEEVNSWDSSSPHSNKEEISECENGDWDSNKDCCRETEVEPFEKDVKGGKSLDWDCESRNDGNGRRGGGAASEGEQGLRPFEDSSLESLDFSYSTDKSTSFEMFNLAKNETNKGEKKNLDESEEDLLVEDLEEFASNNTCEDGPKMSSRSEQVARPKFESIKAEGTPEDTTTNTTTTTTIWMIPKSERTQSSGSNRKSVASSDREKLEKLDEFKILVKKAKSFSDMQRCESKKKVTRSTRSDRLGHLYCEKRNFGNFLLKCEGSSLQRKLEMECKKTKKGISGCESFDRARVYFTEYECRTMTMDKDVSDQVSITSRSIFSSTEEIFSEATNVVSNENAEAANREGPDDRAPADYGLPGPSALDVVSLPDMIGKNSMKERPTKEKFVRRISNAARGRKESESAVPKQANTSAKNANESWFLLDETGQYQAVTRDEVSILLNGRSADTVLLEKKEHVIPNSTLSEAHPPRGSISGLINEESLQYFLREEDVGGEDSGQKLIDLERVENTLLYIQPGTNLTASIRIIPVDTEMIHIWRRSRDNGSLLSSEVDLRLHSSQNSVENENQRIPNESRPSEEQCQSAVEEMQGVASAEEDQQPSLPQIFSGEVMVNGDGGQEGSQLNDRSNLFVETRLIIDELSNNFKVLQSRLDGETNRTLELQQEVCELRKILREFEGKVLGGAEGTETRRKEEMKKKTPCDSSPSLQTSIEKLKEKISDAPDQIPPESESTVSLTISAEAPGVTASQEKMFEKNDSECVYTVDIYTVEESSSNLQLSAVEKSSSAMQTNLGKIESKMKILQLENEIITKQNYELKKKLDEISLELEKYIAGTSNVETCLDEDRELDALRNQVCNLKLELDNMQKNANLQQEKLNAENAVIREELKNKINSVDQWFASTAEVCREVENCTRKLRESGILTGIVKPATETSRDPAVLLKVLNSYVQQITESLLVTHTANLFYEDTLKELTQEGSFKSSEKAKEMDNGTRSEYELPEGSKNKIMEDYFSVMMEKASLLDEIKMLKTENEMLVENQRDHHEKLKQTMIALKDKKSEINALESSKKLTEAEKNKLADVLKDYEEEQKTLENDSLEKSKTIEGLKMENKDKDAKISNMSEKLAAALGEVKNFEKSTRLKDELIKELKTENENFFNLEIMKNKEIQMLTEEIKGFQEEKAQLESELSSARIFLNESQKEMTEYISHLENVVHGTQENLEKTKQKLKESTQVATRLKNDNDVLEKQHQCDLKLFNKTKEELENCREKLSNVVSRLEEVEEKNKNFCKNLEMAARSEKDKSEELNAVAEKCEVLLMENSSLKEKLEMIAKDKDESLKEQKDLINRYSMLSKEVQKLQDKYRNVKTECNQRTDLIKHLEAMLRENILEYSNRIVCLEKSISHVIEKIAVCKNFVREKSVGVVGQVRELRKELNLVYRERRELEKIVTDYYSVTKHLEKEVHDREAKVGELHDMLILEQQKTEEEEEEEEDCEKSVTGKNDDILKVEKLKRELVVAEKEITECKKQFQLREVSHQSEKKKLELTIADLRSEIGRYQLRLDVVMKNLSKSNKNSNCSIPEQRNKEDITSQVMVLRKDIEEKDKKITELNEIINNCKTELRVKESDLINSKEKSNVIDEELKTLQSQFLKLQDILSARNKSNEIQQKERHEITEKLLQSIKLIIEERSARQTIELTAAEKEKKCKEQMDQIRNELLVKSKEYDALSGAFEEKKELVKKLKDHLKSMKLKMASLKAQVNTNNRNSWAQERRNGGFYNEDPLRLSNSLTHVKSGNISPERFELCLKELKEVRHLNLQLRKTEGQYRTKIIQLEDEIRDNRLLIKELQGDVKTENNAKRALKNMIMSAKHELEKNLLAKQIIPLVADKLRMHLELSETPSRELLSGLRLNGHLRPSEIRFKQCS